MNFENHEILSIEDGSFIRIPVGFLEQIGVQTGSDVELSCQDDMIIIRKSEGQKNES